MSSPVSPRPSSHCCFVSSLPLWRSWSRRAWWLHLWLIASLLLPPLSLTQAGVGSYTQNDPISGLPVEYHYEDLNDNGVWDSGEPSWPESEFGDIDSDGLEDGREAYWGTSPYVPDSDYDGISDGDEVKLLGGPANGYNPTLWDTNSDGYSDHDHFYNCFTVDYNTLGAGSSYYDWDGDGTTNPNDPWPTDYYNGGSPPESDSDNDGVYDSSDSHPSNNSLWNDWNGNGVNDHEEDSDGDGYANGIDSHPDINTLWNDWNNNGTNDDQEGGGGSDPTTTDSDGDGHYDAYDSHPSDSSLKSDWNYNGYNDEVDPYLDSDSDSYPNSSDSNPSDSNLWCDWNGNGINDHLEYDPYTTDSDGDGYYDAYDSHINDFYLWNDWNYNGTNDQNEAFDDDGDGYYNGNDSHPQNPALWDDWDDDGLSGDVEATFGSNPNVKDTDGDGLHDGQEHALGTSPILKDTDSDGLTDYEETQLTPASSPTNPHSLSPVYTDWYMRDMTDLDEDGIPGIIERLYGLSDDNGDDALGDLNSNQLTNKQDYDAGNALKSQVTFLDWDGDGLTNIMEYYWGTKVPGILSPWLPHDAVQDADGDGLLNFEELALNLHPGDADSSTPELDVGNQWASPGVLAPLSADLMKARLSHPTWTWPVVPAKAADGSSPAVAGDVDGDGMPDAWEHRHRPLSGNDLSVRSPIDAGQDIDEDGLTNLTEFRYQTDPRVERTNEEDEDGVSFHGQGAPTPTGPPTGLLSRYRAQIAADLAVGTPVNRSLFQNGGVPVAGGITKEPDYEFPYLKFEVTYENKHPDYESNDTISGPREFEVFDLSNPKGCGPPGKECQVEGCSGGTVTRSCRVCNGSGILPCPDHTDEMCSICDGDDMIKCSYCTNGETQTSCGCGGVNKANLCACGDGSCACRSDCGRGRKIASIDSIELIIPDSYPPDAPVGFRVTRDGQEHAKLDRENMTAPAIIAGEGEIIRVRVEDAPSVTVLGSYSAGDQVGPRYRKVGLNGIPIPDSKPQVQDESGEREEETYIDPFNQQLRHSVSDVYVQAEGSLLPLTVRRDLVSETWTKNAGIVPKYRMDRPFGMGWSSNLCSYVYFETPEEFSNVTSKAVAVDEQGTEQTFVRFMGAWTHSREQKADAKTTYNTLISEAEYGLDTSSVKLTKKFGTTCYYKMSGIRYRYTQHPDSDHIFYGNYARLDRVVDRYGNTLQYEYADQDPESGVPKSLIPCRIFDPKRPGHEIRISQFNGHVTSIRGPLGDIINYSYSTLSNSGELSLDVDKVLTKVSKAAGVEVAYAYSVVSEEDPTPSGSGEATEYGHLKLDQITDELGRSYSFNYAGDCSKLGFTYINNLPQNIIQPGQPLLLKKVTGPDGSVVRIDGNREGAAQYAYGNGTNQHKIDQIKWHNYDIISLSQDGVGARIDVVARDVATQVYREGPNNTKKNIYTYRFSEPRVFLPPKTGPDANLVSTQALVSYLKMSIESAAGEEVYRFNERAGMALASATDVSGNKTSYYYSDEEVKAAKAASPSSPLANVNTSELQENRASNGMLYDEPVVEVNALGKVKRMWYDEKFRVLDKVVDARDVVTTYQIDNLGRSTREKVTHPTLGTASDIFYYYDDCFKGRIAKKVVTSFDNSTPSSITEYSLGSKPITQPDDNPGWWREVTASVGGMQWIGQQSQFVPLTSTTTISDFNGNKRSVIDGRGYVTNFGYDGNNRLTSVSFPKKDTAAAEVTKTLEYDLHGNLTKEVNENGVTTIHDYDVLNRRIRTTIHLDDDLNVAARYTSVTYDQAGLPEYNGDLVTETTYNVFNLPVTQTDTRNVRTLHEYDSAGRRIKTTVNDLDPDPANRLVTSFNNGNSDETDDFVGGSVFDVSGFKPLQVTDPRGVVTKFTYDNLYRETSRIVDYGSGPGGINATTHTAYDSVGNVTRVTDPLGRVTEHKYDSLGQVISTTFLADTEATTGPSVLMSYAMKGLPATARNELGHLTRTRYDSAGRPITVVAPGNIETHTRYDAAGNPVEVEDALGRITITTYDERNRPSKVIAPPVWDAVSGGFVRPTTETTYDALGQITSVTDPVGAVTQKFYDPAGRNWKVIAPQPNVTGSSPITLSEYDAAGNVVKLTDPKGNITTNTYDSFGRLLSTEDGAGILNSFTYDKAGNRESVTDGKDQKTQFAYDALNRQVQQTFANGDVWTYAYDKLNKTSQTDPKGVVTSYTYDSRHRLKTVAPGADPVRTYDYDDASRLQMVTEAGQPAADVEYDYDALGRVIAEISRGQTHRYTYDKVGNRTKAIYEDLVVNGLQKGRTVFTSYDTLNRPETIAEGSRLTQYGYDKAGRAVILVLGNGQVTENTYDRLGRLINRTLFRSLGNRDEGGILAEFGWVHDALGNVTAQSETWQGAASLGRSATVRTTAMCYDGANRLKTEVVSDAAEGNVSTSYIYDASNLRIKTVTGGSEPGFWSYYYNNANQLTSWKKYTAGGVTELKSASLTYDLNGNRTSQVIGGTADDGGVNPPNKANGTTSYTWDNTNRLASVTMPDGKQFSYTYDYRMRRVATHASGTGVTPEYTSIVFSGGLSVSEYESASAPGSGGVPAATAPSVQYQRGPDMGGGVGGLLYSLRGTSGSLTPKYSLNNGRGDIVAQSDQAATLTWTASYEAHGRRTVETGTNEDKQRANSKDEDPTGLLNEGWRYRDLETGVWLSRDPAGFVDGPNLYAYVKQNPWTSFDPDGLLTAGEVGEFVFGMGKSYAHAVVAPLIAPYQSVLHPVDSATSFSNTVMDPAGAVASFSQSKVKQWNSGAEGKGEIVMEGAILLASLKSFKGANTRASTTTAEVATNTGKEIAIKEGVSSLKPSTSAPPTTSGSQTQVVNQAIVEAEIPFINPIKAKPGQTQTIAPNSVLAGDQVALSETRIKVQAGLIEKQIPRYDGPPQVNTGGVIVDGHHHLRAAADAGKSVKVNVVDVPVKSATKKPVTKLPTYP